jgi:hypothetical protein
MSETTNVTLKLDAGLVRDARLLAAEEGTSVSRLIADRLEDLVRQRKDYAAAKQRAVRRLRKGLPLGFRRPKSRQELHDR